MCESIKCPHCGSTGEFRYLEDIVCHRRIVGVKDGCLQVECRYEIGEGYDDGDNPRIECRECLGEFPLPLDEVDFVDGDDEEDDEDEDDCEALYMNRYMRNIAHISPDYRFEPNALEFGKYLREHCDWSAEAFGSGYAWETSIPPKDQWEREVKNLNAHLKAIERKELATRTVNPCYDPEKIGSIAYIHADYRTLPNAQAFADYLDAHLDFPAGQCAPWFGEIPPADQWEKIAATLNAEGDTN